MKMSFRYPLALAALVAFGAPHIHAGESDPGYVDFGKFTPPANGSEFVEVRITGNLISMVARLAEKSEPEVANLLRGLREVRVNVVGLTDDNRAGVEKRIRQIREKLDAAGWERLVTVQQKDADVAVFLKTRGEEAVEGLAVTVIDHHRQAVFANIVGDIKPEKVALLGERLHIEPLKEIGQEIGKR
jgi:Domain of unknown function (DUF4252)